MESSGAGEQRKLNVLLAASTLWLGGAEAVVKHLAENLDRDRFNVTVCHLKERGVIGDEMVEHGIDVVGVDRKPGRVDYFTAMKLRQILRSRRIDVIHTHMTHALVDASLCRLIMPRLKLVHTFHFGNYPHTEPRVLGFERVFSRVPDRLYAVGENQRRQIREVFGFSERRISTVRNGVELRASTPNHEFRQRVGAVDRPLIGTVATFIEQKGLRDLLKVARRLKDQGSRAVFVVAGEGHLRAELERLRHELDLDDTVVLTGWIANAAETVLPNIDVFFQPSLWEAMSMVVLEAMAAGKPVVATAVGENSEVITEDQTGYLVSPGDVDGMAAALQRLIEDPARATSMGEAARTRVSERFTVAHMVRDYERAYQEVVA